MNETIDLLAIDADFAIKATDDEGGIEGPCAPFGDADRSRMKDRFHKGTEFGRAMKVGADVLMHHSLPMIGDKPNTMADAVLAEATFEMRDDALWMKSRLPLDTDENRRLFTDIKAGKYGLSTGSSSHLVRRTKLDDSTHRIDKWPISEVSITPRDMAAHPRTAVYAIKSLMPDGAEAAPVNESPPEAPESVGFVESLKRAESALAWAIGKELNGTKQEALKSLTETVKRYRDSHIDPAKVQAAFARSEALINRFIKD